MEDSYWSNEDRQNYVEIQNIIKRLELENDADLNITFEFDLPKFTEDIKSKMKIRNPII